MNNALIVGGFPFAITKKEMQEAQKQINQMLTLLSANPELKINNEGRGYNVADFPKVVELEHFLEYLLSLPSK